MPLGILAGMNRVARELVDADRFVGAGDGEAAAVEHDIVLGGFHQVGGDLGAFGDDFCAAVTSAAARHSRTRTECAGADCERIGVAPFEPDLVGTDAELSRDDLAPGGQMALAVVMRANQDGDRTGRIEAISACSIRPALDASTVLEMPMPRSLSRRAGS